MIGEFACPGGGGATWPIGIGGCPIGSRGFGRAGGEPCG